MSGAVRTVGKIVGKIFGMPDPSEMQQQAPQIIMPPAVQPVSAPPMAQASQLPSEADKRTDTQRRTASASKSATMLTGPGGVDPTLLNVGKTGSSLLGL